MIASVLTKHMEVPSLEKVVALTSLHLLLNQGLF